MNRNNADVKLALAAEEEAVAWIMGKKEQDGLIPTIGEVATNWDYDPRTIEAYLVAEDAWLAVDPQDNETIARACYCANMAQDSSDYMAGVVFERKYRIVAGQYALRTRAPSALCEDVGV